MQFTEHGFPRRNDITRYTPAEAAISQAMYAVEEAGAHPLLTEAVTLLSQAKEKVADFVELDEEETQFRAHVEAIKKEVAAWSEWKRKVANAIFGSGTT